MRDIPCLVRSNGIPIRGNHPAADFHPAAYGDRDTACQPDAHPNSKDLTRAYRNI